MDNKESIAKLISDSLETKKKMLEQNQIECIEKIVNKIIETYKNKRKVIICGNGGSSADALHFAAEMVVRFEKNRAALPCITLSSNVSSLTAIGNDFGYDASFSRQLEAFAQNGDIFIAISTSGNSKNVIEALILAKKLNIFTIGFTNTTGGKMKDICDLCFCAPSSITARTQECHILLVHIIAKLVEEKIFN
ncbi:MAG: SIS domain-containing protein [Endomicrobium sp.]|jgi:D-sedoheptulose 7-phosphate isomerase|uniref:D-sedoheptulose-7-phosphate isomerase n=1 Tax=Candidatus Endomicrobiellum cubanum TaxID=3242325 RepID=UPI00283A60DF|nr:SIS domain-containing protein [Endomicrobium sp.]